MMQAREFISVQDQVIKITGLYGIKFLSSLIYPFIESYWVTFCFLANSMQKFSLSLFNLAFKVQYLADTLYSEGQLINYDCCSMEAIANALNKLTTLGILTPRNAMFRDEHSKEYWYAEEEDNGKLKELYERTSFLKPVVAVSQGFLKFEDDVKRILAKPNKKGPGLAKL
mmetsp:Transcript_29850/g.29007  ORF Transcript_29850/g.29007 Transcript_29850/m.29007 type:complete len:170 (-) Transcript_29850:17-526(-)